MEYFVTELVDKTQSLLYALDECVTVDDVISGGEIKITIYQCYDNGDCVIDHLINNILSTAFTVDHYRLLVLTIVNFYIILIAILISFHHFDQATNMGKDQNLSNC